MGIKGAKRKSKNTEGSRRRTVKRRRGRTMKRLRGRPLKTLKEKPGEQLRRGLRERLREDTGKKLEGTEAKIIKERNIEKEEKEEEVDTFFKESKKKYASKGLTIITEIESNSSILQKYEEINQTYYNNLDDKYKKEKYKNIFISNSEKTEKEKANEFGKKLYSILSTNSYKKTNNIIKPNVTYNHHLNDEEFLELVSAAKDYSNKTKSSEQNEIIKNKFIANKKYIEDLFKKERIIKDLLENAILSILINDFDYNELDNNFNYLTVEDISPCPMISLKFNYKNKNFDLNKENLKKEATSYIPLLIFQSTMKEFSDGYKMKKEELKEKINEYIENHEIYFGAFKDDIQGLTIHTGATYINLKYLREYFDNDNFDKTIIIRTKILQIYLHEINHGLLRSIGKAKNKDFFNNSKSKRPKKDYILKSIQNPYPAILPSQESGNFFDSLFYCGYYLDFIDINVAEFYLEIDSFKTKEDYSKKLTSVINKINTNSSEQIFKFRKNYSINIPQCGFSRMRMNRNIIDQYFKIRNFKKFNEKLESEESEEKDNYKSMEDIDDEIKKEKKSHKNQKK